MSLELEQIKEIEERVLHDRKGVILEKIDYVYHNEGVNGSDVFLDYLEQNTSFSYGQVADIDKFKKVFLTNFKRLDDFNKVYLNSGADVDELLFCGFDDKLVVVNEMDFYEVVYDKITDYEFTPEGLNEFEAFVDEIFYNCCH